VCGAGAVVRRRGDAICGRTAAIAHGLPTLAVPTSVEVVTRGPGGAGPRGAVNLRAGILDGWQMTTWFGVDVGDVARTLVDLGRGDRRDAIMAADAALREDLVTRREIDRALALAFGWPGVIGARSALALADPLAESPLESVTRLTILDAGLPAPQLQCWIGQDRVDLYWPEFRFVLEADGRVKYTAEERWQEKTREQRIRRHGNRVERVTWADVTSGWRETRRMLTDILR
jgi:very-short-patch-repair endonuclease